MICCSDYDNINKDGFAESIEPFFADHHDDEDEDDERLRGDSRCDFQRSQTLRTLVFSDERCLPCAIGRTSSSILVLVGLRVSAWKLPLFVPPAFEQLQPLRAGILSPLNSAMGKYASVRLLSVRASALWSRG